MNNKSQHEILVLGGTGKTGSRIVQRLKERGIPVRVGSRQASPAFTWDNPATWNASLDNVRTVYISFQPDIAIPGAVAIIERFVETAIRKGVTKMVLLSGRGEAEAQACEQVVIQSGVAWTIVRASWFNQNFSEGYLLEPVLAGHVALPVPPMVEPFIDTDDIADVATAALVDNKHNGQIYEVTGPRLLTFQQAIAEIATASGRAIAFETIPMQAYEDAMKGYNVPADVLSLIKYLFTEVMDGRNAHVTDGVQRALGRPPKDFAVYAKEVAQRGVWNAATV